jgi:hypothetical protein
MLPQRVLLCLKQVRAVADLLPQMEVVEGDPFNSSPTDPQLMGPDALQRFRAGEKLPAVTAKTPLVSSSSVGSSSDGCSSSTLGTMPPAAAVSACACYAVLCAESTGTWSES